MIATLIQGKADNVSTTLSVKSVKSERNEIDFPINIDCEVPQKDGSMLS